MYFFMFPSSFQNNDFLWLHRVPSFGCTLYISMLPDCWTVRFYYFIIIYNVATNMTEYISLSAPAYFTTFNFLCFLVFQKYGNSLYLDQNKWKRPLLCIFANMECCHLKNSKPFPGKEWNYFILPFYDALNSKKTLLLEISYRESAEGVSKL